MGSIEAGRDWESCFESILTPNYHSGRWDSLKLEVNPSVESRSKEQIEG